MMHHNLSLRPFFGSMNRFSGFLFLEKVHQAEFMNSDGSRQRFITYGVNPSWSVHDEIVFSHANSDYTKEVLYTIKPDGSARTQITN
jgi:hypothetical protein